MAKNLDWSGAPQSCCANNDSANELLYGRLYAFASAEMLPPASNPPSPTPWRLPTLQEWETFQKAFGNNAYAAMMPGGATGFNAQLGGFYDGAGHFSEVGTASAYWSTLVAGGMVSTCSLNSADQSFHFNELQALFYASVRYVRNAS
jgi:uncharacterized protein (TIGR02145 family)